MELTDQATYHPLEPRSTVVRRRRLDRLAPQPISQSPHSFRFRH
jgi:hypothetical protein